MLWKHWRLSYPLFRVRVELQGLWEESECGHKHCGHAVPKGLVKHGDFWFLKSEISLSLAAF